MLSKQDGAEFKSILRDECSYMLRPEEPQALLFSGGTDSLTVLWTLLELGARPTCYTFRLESVESSDAKASALAAQAWGVDRVEVAVPDAPLPELAAEVGNIARLIGSARKTHVEVMWPLHHVLAAVAPDERQVWTGIQADTLYGSSRSMAIRYGKDPRAFREAREKLVADPGQEGLAQLRALAATFGKGICAPYATAAVRRFMAR